MGFKKADCDSWRFDLRFRPHAGFIDARPAFRVVVSFLPLLHSNILPLWSMEICGITWHGEQPDDSGLLDGLPSCLAGILKETNGFILHGGALHVRGAVSVPDWHSLRAACQGPKAFHELYKSVQAGDIPFAQDQFGDQFLYRNSRVFRLESETGDLEALAESLEEFFTRVNEDIEGFLNVGLDHAMQPGQLLLAYPPFVFRESGAGASLKAVSAEEVILFHAELARQLQDVPDGGRIQLAVTD